MVGKYQKPPSLKTLKKITCTHCEAPIQIRAALHSHVVSCSYCGAMTDLKSLSGELKAIDTPNNPKKKPLKSKSIIPLGARGKLHGTEWEVIGFIRKKTIVDGEYVWDEYLLFNPFKGYRWLSEIDGHWNYVVSLHELPKHMPEQKAAVYLGDSYSLFHKVHARVLAVEGEFYWDVKPGDQVIIEEYIHPPFILTQERTNNRRTFMLMDDIKTDEMSWSLGEYIDQKVIANAFRLDVEDLPAISGVSPNQPCPYAPRNKPILIIAVLFSVFLILMHMIFSHQGGHQLKSLQSISITKSMLSYEANQRYFSCKQISSDFHIDKTMGIVDIVFDAPLENNWIDIEMDMVNKETGESIPLDVELFFYTGVDDEGMWVEASQRTSVEVTNVPVGTYYLDMKINGSFQGEAYTIPITFKISEGRISLFDLFYILFFIWCFALFHLWQVRYRHFTRWRESQYSPYYGKGTLEWLGLNRLNSQDD